MAPILDGEKRGWGVPTLDPYDNEYEDEELEQDEVGERHIDDGHWLDSGEYRSTNSFLHELHTLHQHRVSNCPTSSPLASSSQIRQPTSSQSSPLRPSIRFSPSGYDNVPTKSALPPISELSANVTSLYEELDVQRSLHGHDGGNMMIVDEVQMVKERYEDTNRLLGSLVLSRRRELQGSPDQT